jgi:mannose-6-phosphate isomerase
MTQMDESRPPHLRAVIAEYDQFSAWLLQRALPLWDEHGVDRRSGGYFETLSKAEPEGIASAGAVRRGRVVARQIYVFDVGRRLGWRSSRSCPVQHGCEYLFSRLYAGDGLFHTALSAATHQPCAPFSLYEHAFYLFALARVEASMSARYPIGATGAICLARLRASFGRPGAGFEESAPPSLPLKSNPHMHLLEAALGWVAATQGPAQRSWVDLARELVGLCLTQFRDAPTGAIREYFDYQWRALPGDAGRLVEPGHQFEWAWLLMQWAASGHCTGAERAACLAAAAQLIELAERWGVDPGRGIAINEIWDDMSLKDPAAKLWPQTERVKAWCAMLERAPTAVEAERACRHLAAAARGLRSYLRADAPGLWFEECGPAGEFAPTASKASSLYHIACAIEVMGSAVGARLRAERPAASTGEASFKRPSFEKHHVGH